MLGKQRLSRKYNTKNMRFTAFFGFRFSVFKQLFLLLITFKLKKNRKYEFNSEKKVKLQQLCTLAAISPGLLPLWSRAKFRLTNF